MLSPSNAGSLLVTVFVLAATTMAHGPPDGWPLTGGWPRSWATAAARPTQASGLVCVHGESWYIPSPSVYGLPSVMFASPTAPTTTSASPTAPTTTSASPTAPTTTSASHTAPMTTSAACLIPTYTYGGSFTYTPETSDRYATPISSPVAYTTFAPHFSQVSTLLPSNIIYTTYSLNPAATQPGQYGESAYVALWSTYSFNNTVPFTTTRTPTPVASSELVFPPALYTPCPSTYESCLGGYCLSKDFVWGIASSAWQVEGGTQIEGRGPSQLDIIGNLLGPANMSEDAVIADMQYFLYKQDIIRIAALGIPYYSFSISWTRVVPFGQPGSPINQQALDHYDDVINFAIANGVTPICTITHADNPVSVPFDADNFVDAFLYYSKVVLTRYADRVPYWVTINEPNINTPTYASNLNVLMGHASVYHFYKDTLGASGQMTLKFANNIALPLNQGNESDIQAALRYQDFIVGIEGNPLFRGAQYPASVLSTTGINLTALSAENLAYINNTMDFLSVDPYTAQFATQPPGGIDACAANPNDPLWPNCVITTNVQANGWLNGDESYAYAYLNPQYFRQHMKYLWQTFRPKGILIAEFGFNPYMEYSRTLDAQRYDLERTLYYQEFLAEMLKVIYEDGVNIIGALGWSALDNNEFGSYMQQYGMQFINRTLDGPDFMKRTYKRSIFDYVDWFHAHIK